MAKFLMRPKHRRRCTSPLSQSGALNKRVLTGRARETHGRGVSASLLPEQLLLIIPNKKLGSLVNEARRKRKREVLQGAAGCVNNEFKASSTHSHIECEKARAPHHPQKHSKQTLHQFPCHITLGRRELFCPHCVFLRALMLFF